MNYLKSIALTLTTLLALFTLLLTPTSVNAQFLDTYNAEDLVKTGDSVDSNPMSDDNKDNAELEDNTKQTVYLEGKVIEIIKQEYRSPYEGAEKQLYQKLLVKITRGDDKGTTFEYENGGYALVEVVEYKVGDNVTITKQLDGNNEVFYQITGFQRTTPIWIMLGIFVVLSLLIGGRMSLNALIAMVLTFVVILAYLLPQIGNGSPPVWTAVLASIAIIPLTFYLSHGFNRKTTVAVIATLIALIITGLLSQLFVNMTNLTGTADEEALLLQSLGVGNFDLKGILLAGIIIGTLGALDDVTVSQSAIVFGLYDVKKKLGFSELFFRAMSIGKDHIASMINTLILVYTGASMPLLLIFTSKDVAFGEIINYELLVTEIVRTLVGSIALVLAVPITTYLAAIVVKYGWLKFKFFKADTHEHHHH